MKLTSFQSERSARRLKSTEVVGAPEPIELLEFDPTKVVPEYTWLLIDSYLKTERVWRSRQTLPFIRLSVLDPELQKRAKQDQDLADEVQSEIYDHVKHEWESDLKVNGELARYASLLPEVLDRLDNSSFPFPHDLQKSLDTLTEYPSREFYIGQVAMRVKGLIQLFPENRSLIYDKLQTIQMWDKAIQEAREISRLPGQVIDYLPALLANLAIIFPEKIDEILGVIRPHWIDLQQRMQTWGITLGEELDHVDVMDRPRSGELEIYVDNILGMSVLAELSHKKKLSSPQPLPQRLVA